MEKEEEWKMVTKHRRKGRKGVVWDNPVIVFINNLPEPTLADHLRHAFVPVGKVFDAYIPPSSCRGNGACFGFVRFGDMKTAIKAVELMDGYIFAGRRLAVNVARYGWSNRRVTRDV